MQNYTLVNNIPGSKSYANRALAYSFIINKEISFKNMPISDDVQNMISALEQIQNKDKVIDLGEGGTTIRFLLPIICSQEHEVLVKVHPRFKQRPIEAFYKLLKSLGAKIELSSKADELGRICGPLRPSISLSVDCSETTQFLSSLMLVAKKLNLKLIPKNIETSKKYIELTSKVIDDVEKMSSISIPVDSSSSSYILAWGVLNKTLKLSQIKSRDPYQADDSFLDILKSLGANYKFEDGLIIYKSDDLCALDIDVSEFLDLTPTLVYLSLFIKGKTKFSGIKNLKFKEVDRLSAITEVLDKLGASYSVCDSYLEIDGQKKLNNVNLSPAADHRIVMMCALVCKQLGSQVIDNRDCVSKSFPNFFDIIDNI